MNNWNAKGRPGARLVFTTPSEFFAQFESGAPRLFDFNQTLRGRDAQLQALNGFLVDPASIVGVLTGRGGIGKSKLLHDWVQTVTNRTVLPPSAGRNVTFFDFNCTVNSAVWVSGCRATPDRLTSSALNGTVEWTGQPSSLAL